MDRAEAMNRIIASYEWHDDDDISTERLLAMVADDCDCDVSKVIEVIGEHWESMWGGDTERPLGIAHPNFKYETGGDTE